MLIYCETDRATILDIICYSCNQSNQSDYSSEGIPAFTWFSLEEKLSKLKRVWTEVASFICRPMLAL